MIIELGNSAADRPINESPKASSASDPMREGSRGLSSPCHIAAH